MKDQDGPAISAFYWTLPVETYQNIPIIIQESNTFLPLGFKIYEATRKDVFFELMKIIFFRKISDFFLFLNFLA